MIETLMRALRDRLPDAVAAVPVLLHAGRADFAGSGAPGDGRATRAQPGGDASALSVERDFTQDMLMEFHATDAARAEEAGALALAAILTSVPELLQAANAAPAFSAGPLTAGLRYNGLRLAAADPVPPDGTADGGKQDGGFLLRFTFRVSGTAILARAGAVASAPIGKVTFGHPAVTGAHMIAVTDDPPGAENGQ